MALPEAMAGAVPMAPDAPAEKNQAANAGRVAAATPLAVVRAFAAKVDPATRTMITEVDVPNPANTVMPGMYAEVSLQLAHRSDVLTAPLDALERTGGSARVFAVDESGTVRIVPVQLVEDAARAEIVSGLRESDLIITGKRAGLSAGDRVKAKLPDTDR